ncbi:transcription termination/antitermination NusG family protein [Klebsiella sp. PL-2018]|uniref:transcription termination/antitermination NusG family protein n=1 Tax=Klebsiella TaxID=570 RepID=UPI001C24798A|nr:transcription termination/antitermination NusG family protein [Klebsiella sp. PL-2018]
MSRETDRHLRWYLAQHITTGKQRQLLFAWLSEQRVTPWTPLVATSSPRADRENGCRNRISQVFPGYFFLQADLSVHSVSTLRRHSAFLDFVSFGSGPCTVSDRVVEELMSLYPEDATPRTRCSHPPLTRAQYSHLIRLENNTQPVSRISMLLDLIRQPDAVALCE